MARRKKRVERTNKNRTEAASAPLADDNISISKVTAKYTAGSLCLMLLLGAGAFIHYGKTVSTANSERAELDFLRQTNKTQSEKIDELSKVTVSLQTDMERLNALDVEIRSIVNNDSQIATSRAGLVRPQVGHYSLDSGQLSMEEITQRVNELKATIKVREESLSMLKEELLAKKARFAATPSIWPAEGEISSRFGRRGAEFHPGIDIAGDEGTSVVATADGVVIHSGWDDGGYGKMVHISHGNGISTVYAHNSAIVVAEGQAVKKGELIAYSGSTGYSTGPHVHYEVRINGTAVNPSKFLK